MFVRAKKQSQPSSIFDKRKRIWCILQLCLAFTSLCWYLGYPFLGEMYFLKKERGLVEFVLSPFQKEYYAELPLLEQQQLKDRLQTLEKGSNKSALKKLKGMLYSLFLYASPLEICWIIAGILLPYWILRERKEATLIWILPILTLVFAIEGAFWGSYTRHEPDLSLFPSEAVLLEQLGKNQVVDSSRQTLQKSWENYLSEVWGEGNLDKGIFRFTLARIYAWKNNSVQVILSKHLLAFIQILIYLFWNILLAWKIHPISLFTTRNVFSWRATI